MSKSTVKIWKDVPGYENLYKANIYGEIKSYNRKVQQRSHLGKKYLRFCKGVVLKTNKARNGYLHVCLYKETSKAMSVHSIICLTFIGNRPHLYEINHKDGNKENNCIKNLEYVTFEENRRHAKLNGFFQIGERSGRSKLKNEQVLSIREEYFKGNTSYTKLGKKYNVLKGTIGDIVKRNHWRHI